MNNNDVQQGVQTMERKPGGTSYSNRSQRSSASVHRRAGAEDAVGPAAVGPTTFKLGASLFSAPRVGRGRAGTVRVRQRPMHLWPAGRTAALPAPERAQAGRSNGSVACRRGAGFKTARWSSPSIANTPRPCWDATCALSMETGRVPSLLGARCFQGNVTSYRVKSFEGRRVVLHRRRAVSCQTHCGGAGN